MINKSCLIGLFILLAIGLLPMENANAAEDDPDIAAQLAVEEEIVVTASRREVLLKDTADIVQIITKTQIETLNPTTTGEIVEYATGVAVETGTGSGLPQRSIVSVNGLPANYTLVLLDGVPLVTEHIHTGQNLEFIPADSVDRIEIVRGAASAQYGSDAIGGIVNVITTSGRKKEGSIKLTAGSYGTYDGSLNLRLPFGGRVKFASSFNWEQTDGVPLLAPTHRIGNMGYEQTNFLNRIDIDASDSTRMFAWVNWVSNTMDWRGATTDATMLTPVFGLTQRLSPSAELNVRASYSDWDAELNLERDQRIEPEAYVTWRIGQEHTVMAGADYEWNSFERTAIPQQEQQTVGAFVQDDWISGDTFSLMAALRFDHVQDIADAITPKISAMFAPAAWLRCRASIGRGFHAPSLMELYEEGYGHGGTAYRFGNPDLKPEYSITYTAGIEVEPSEALEFVIYGFYNDLDDMIVPVYTGPWDKDPSKNVWMRTNIKSARVYGAEFSLRARAGNLLSLEAGYTYSDNEDPDSGRQLPYSPGSAASGKITLSHAWANRFDIKLFGGVRAVFDRKAWNWQPAAGSDPTNPNGLTTPLNDYTKLDAGLSFTYLRTYQAFIKAENLLGEEIENLDDAYTILDGEPVITGGIVYTFPF